MPQKVGGVGWGVGNETIFSCVFCRGLDRILLFLFRERHIFLGVDVSIGGRVVSVDDYASASEICF